MSGAIGTAPRNAGDEEQTITAPTPPQGQTSSGPPSPEESAEEREEDREARMRERAKRREIEG